MRMGRSNALRPVVIRTEGQVHRSISASWSKVRSRSGSSHAAATRGCRPDDRPRYSLEPEARIPGATGSSTLSPRLASAGRSAETTAEPTREYSRRSTRRSAGRGGHRPKDPEPPDRSACSTQSASSTRSSDRVSSCRKRPSGRSRSSGHALVLRELLCSVGPQQIRTEATMGSMLPGVGGVEDLPRCRRRGPPRPGIAPADPALKWVVQCDDDLAAILDQRPGPE